MIPQNLQNGIAPGVFIGPVFFLGAEELIQLSFFGGIQLHTVLLNLNLHIFLREQKQAQFSWLGHFLLPWRLAGT